MAAKDCEKVCLLAPTGALVAAPCPLFHITDADAGADATDADSTDADATDANATDANAIDAD